jgi:hypothetical protein
VRFDYGELGWLMGLEPTTTGITILKTFEHLYGLQEGFC